MKQVKLEARERIAQILAASLRLAPRVGYMRLTREAVAAELGLASSSLICYHMGTAAKFKRAVMREAVRTECLPVIAQGIVAKDPQALKVPHELRTRALASLAS